MTSFEPRALENLEGMLERMQKMAAILEGVIRKTWNPSVLECLREILADVMAHWDAVGHHLAVINRPDIEKRSHVRLRALGEMTLTDLAEHRQISGQCIDWSDVGLCALVDVGLTPGAVYSLSFRLLGSSNPISAKATIRWCRVRLDGRSFRVGFEFQD